MSRNANRLRRAAIKRRRRTNGGTLSQRQWRRIKEIVPMCIYCGDTEKALTRDCFIALAKGGMYCAINVVPACLSCNCSKGGKNAVDWAKSKGYDLDELEARMLAIWEDELLWTMIK